MGYSKYGNRKMTIDGILFDSQREAGRYRELRLLEKAGVIRNLKLQEPYELLPAQREPSTLTKTGRERAGRVIERSVVYKADFAYEERTGEAWAAVVEDAKGMRTKEYIIKRKLMLFIHGIKIREV